MLPTAALSPISIILNLNSSTTKPFYGEVKHAHINAMYILRSHGVKSVNPLRLSKRIGSLDLPAACERIRFSWSSLKRKYLPMWNEDTYKYNYGSF